MQRERVQRSVIRSVLGVCLIVSMVGSMAQGLGAQASASEGAIFLLLPVGGQAISLGRAMTAIDGQESAFWNPAGLAALRDSRAVLFRGSSNVGTSTAVSLLFGKPDVGVLGISYLLWDAGEIERRDENNNELGIESLRNHLVIVSTAATLLPHLSVGINLKLVQFRLSCRGICGDRGSTSSTYAVDAGVQVKPSEHFPFRLGAMLSHVGPAFQHENAEQADPLPGRIRLAAAYDFLHNRRKNKPVEGWLVAEVQDHFPRLNSPAVYLGTELAAGEEDRLFLRAGYIIRDRDRPTGGSVGVGIALRQFELSVAKSLTESALSEATDPVTVALSLRGW